METLVAVLIIAVLGVLVVPRFTDAAGESQAGGTLSQLRAVRTALRHYAADHHGVYPPADKLWADLTGRTDAQGRRAADAPLGPYLSGVPRNIYTNTSRVTPDMSSNDPSFGWCYDPTAPLLFRAVGFDEATQTFSTTPE